MPDWNSRQYLKFSQERTQPAIDLVNRITTEPPHKILDIGCGPGNSTEVLSIRYPNAYILGVDNSPNMIESAQREHPNLHFAYCDANRELNSLNKDFDIVFSNACIQWLPNHHQLLRSMMDLLKPGGVMAVQTPMNYDEPIHLLIQRVTTSEKWRRYFPEARIFFNLTPSEYFDLLGEISAEFQIWTTIYYHAMSSHQAILDWYRSTGLRPYLNVLPEALKPDFEQDIFAEIVKEYPPQSNGLIIFRFPRFFFTAQK